MSITSPSAGPSDDRGIGWLIQELRGNGFDVRTSEAIDATRLLIILSGNEREPKDPARLCARLRPIFCKSLEQQNKFREIFDRWIEFKATADVTPPEPPGGTLVTLTGGPKKKDRRRWMLWALAGVLAVLLIAVVAADIYFQMQNPGPAVRDFPTVAPPKNIQTPPKPIEKPVPAENAVSQNTTNYGYFPALRYNVELRPGWAWFLASLPLVALIGFSVPALVLVRTRAQRRGDPMYLDRGPLEEDARRIVPPLRPDIADRLARHLRLRSDDDSRPTRRPLLDLRSTIERSLRNRGVPTPCYRNTQAHPSYLLLVDVANQKDPRGRMFYQWAERLQRERLEVDIALVRLNEEQQPQFARPVRGDVPPDNGSWQPLAQLPRPPFGQRLLLISTGDPLVDQTGAWRGTAEAARLHRWRERALFTPIEPRDWGPREESIERREHTADAGFLVLPLDENALSAWTDLLNTGQLSHIILSEPQRYPAVLRRGKGGDFAGEEPPSDSDRVERLVSQLRVYLGEEGFTWLAALAIPPLIRWELTLLLGRDLLATFADRRKDLDALLARNYQRLARLPWLRLESMPDWLRLRLIAELPPSVQVTVRKVVESLLGGLSPAAGVNGIALDFERPPGPFQSQPSRTESGSSDPLYLGYMSGLTPQQLAIRAPAQWGKWLGGIRLPREQGLRGWFARSSDQTRAWWARRMFLGGMPFSGIRRGSFVWALALLVLAAGLLALVTLIPTNRWLDPVSDRLFDEQTHSIAFEHARPVSSAAFSPDGRWVVTSSDDGTARVWDAKSGAPISSPLRHAGPVHSAAFSPNGQQVLTASEDGTARVWNAKSGAPMTPPLRHGGPVDHAAFSADGRRIVTASEDRTARVWDVQSGKQVGSLQHPQAVSYAEFSPDGRIIITTSQDHKVRVWDEVKGVFRESHFPNRNLISRPAISHDGQWVVGRGGPYNSAAIMDVTSGAPFFPFSARGIKAAQFSPDSHKFLTVGEDNTVRVFDMESGRLVGSPRHHADLVTDAEFSQDGRMIVTASRDKTVRVWDAQTGQPIGNPLRHDDGVTFAKFSPDGLRIVTAGRDKTARMWETGGSHPIGAPMRHKDLVMNAEFSPDGRRVVTGSWDRSARVWDAKTGEPVSPPMRHRDQVWWASFSPDGRSVVTASADKTARIWQSDNGQFRTRPLEHGKEVYYATFSPDGSRVLTASGDDTARIWDARTGLAIVTLRHQDTVWHALFSPDGHRVVTVTNNAARVWDAKTGKPVGRPIYHGDTLFYAAFSPDSRRVVTASADGTARIWNADSGSLLLPPLRHSTMVYHAVFSPDGRWVVTASADQTAQVWNAQSGKPQGAPLHHKGGVNFAAFSPDALRVITASDDGTARVWSAERGELLGAPLMHTAAVLLAVFSPNGRLVVTATSSNFTRGKGSGDLDSAQVWHAYPLSTPAASQAGTLRKRADEALARLSSEKVKSSLAFAAECVPFVIAFIIGRRRKPLRAAVARAARDTE